MNEIDKVKEVANPFAQLTKATNKHAEKTDTVIALLVAIADGVDSNLLVNQDTLEEKKSNHNEWVRVSKHRRYINIAAVMATCAILWLDVLKLNPNSEIVGSAVTIAKTLAGLFL